MARLALFFRRPLLTLCAATAAAGWILLSWSFDDWLFSVGLLCLLISGGTALFLTHRRTDTAIRETELQNYRQVEALMGLLRWWDGDAQTLPPLRGFAISPDFAMELIRIIRDKKPKVVVELGSGASTLLCALALKRQGFGRLTTVDHDASYAASTTARLVDAGLEDVVDVVVAPLKNVGKSMDGSPWYDEASFKDLSGIDLLVVDGPPADISPHIRYPALPVLVDRLAPEVTILLDDTGRPAEQEVLTRWLAEFPEFQRSDLEFEEGASYLVRRTQSRS